VKSKAEYCVHLKNAKGREFQGKPVYEVLHGITFTGMGLLDREGADEKAEIRKVASQQRHEGGGSMADDKGKTRAEDTPVDPADLSDAEKVKLIKKQQADLDRLTQENEDLKAKLEEAQAAHKAIVRRAKAEKLLAAWEDAGRAFEGDPAKTAELDRLLKLSDEAFDATEAAVQAFAAGKKKVDPANPDDEEDPAAEDGKPPFPPKKKPAKKGSLTSDASRLAPAGSPDGSALVAELTTGFLAAYQERVGTDA